VRLLASVKGKDILSIADLSHDSLHYILNESKRLKDVIEKRTGLLKNRTLGLFFEKPSTRTRVSFETATYQLGGNAIYLRSDELQLKRGEPIKDTARVLSSYLDGLIIRTYNQDTLEQFAKYSDIPVINALSDLEHPTQIICDFLTVLEAKGRLEDLNVTWVGDGNNVCNSLLLFCGIIGLNILAACPAGYEPNSEILREAKEFAANSGSKIIVTNDPLRAVEKADVLYTDVWVSMGQEKGAVIKEKSFEGFQINAKLLKRAKDDVVVMHCLPAHRGMEITDEVLEGEKSIVWKQAENKLHGARGILASIIP
jgi:ornithine carbamoyltransferase